MTSLFVFVVILSTWYIAMITNENQVFGMSSLSKRSSVADTIYNQNLTRGEAARVSTLRPVTDATVAKVTAKPIATSRKAKKKKPMPDWAWAVLGIGILPVIISGIIAYVVINSKKRRIGSLLESSIPSNAGTPDTSPSPVNIKPEKL